jgi:hypothetical protein
MKTRDKVKKWMKKMDEEGGPLPPPRDKTPPVDNQPATIKLPADVPPRRKMPRRATKDKAMERIRQMVQKEPVRRKKK